MSHGGHSEPLLLVTLFYQSTPSCLKVMGGVGWCGGVGGGGGPCDYCVSPVQRVGFVGFFRLGLTLGSGFGVCWDRGLGT